ncbi:hypothetical protein IWW50_006855, partial [Coemansia erecta]
MSVLLGDNTNVSQLLMIINFATAHIDVRMALVTMISRWCVIFGNSLTATKNLKLLVDAFYHNTGNLPKHEFMTALPKDIQLHDGWEYPPMKAVAGDMSFFYMPTEPDACIAATPNAARQVQLQQQQQPTATGVSSQEEGLAHMDGCAQKLKSIGEMLKDNLRKMTCNENPQSNEVIQEIMRDLNQALSAVLDHLNTLTTVSGNLNSAVALAQDSLGFYDNVVKYHDDWTSGRDTFAKPPSVQTPSTAARAKCDVTQGSDAPDAL